MKRASTRPTNVLTGHHEPFEVGSVGGGSYRCVRCTVDRPVRERKRTAVEPRVRQADRPVALGGQRRRPATRSASPTPTEPLVGDRREGMRSGLPGQHSDPVRRAVGSETPLT
jgi:hypothetical protein